MNRVRRNAELGRNPVGRAEPDPADVAGEAKRVFPNHRDGVVAKPLVNPRGVRGAHPVALEKDHDLPHALLLDPGFLDPAGAFRADPFHLAELGGELVDHLERAFAEMIDNSLGELAADPRHQAAAEVFLDPDHRAWQD